MNRLTKRLGIGLCGTWLCLGGQVAQAEQVPNFRQLVENFTQLSPQQVLASLHQLTQNDWLQLSIYGAFNSWVHLRGCEADPNLVFNMNGMATGCQQTYQQWMQTYQFSGGNVQQTFEYANSQRMQLLISMRCGSGEIDQNSCNSYVSGMTNYNNMMNETSQTIIDNMGGGQCDNPGGYDWRGYCAPR